MSRRLLPIFLIVLIVSFAVSSFAATQIALPDMPAEARQKLSGSLQMQLVAKQRIVDQTWPASSVDGWLIRGDESTRAIGDHLVYVHLDAYPSPAQIDAMAATGAELILSDWIPPLENHPTGFFLARVPVNAIDDLALLPFVERLGNGEDVLAPQNDIARELNGVNAAVNTYGAVYNQGNGVRVAVLDSGVDIDHPDIPVPVHAVDYSEWPDSNFTVGNTVTGHGTHVAGTVLGRGTASGGLYAGMATEAELVFLKIGNDAEGLETSAGVTHSFIAAREYYDCDVASMSYGYFNEFLDGSMENEQAVDYVVDDGMIVFISAGNSANDDHHYSLTVPANTQSAFIGLTVSQWATGQVFLVNVIAYDGPNTDDRTFFDLTAYDNNFLPLDATVSEQQQSPRGTESRYLLGDEVLPSNADHRYITIANNSDHDQVFHLYVGVQTLGPYSIGYEFNNGDPQYTVGSPAIADGAIAVAAYTSRTEWEDYNGETHTASGTIGDIASFSSIGPRIDGLQKPDIASPGSMIASARDGDVSSLQPGGSYDNYILLNPGDAPGTPGDYVLFRGTSMACPAASGATAAVMANWFQHGADLPLGHMVRQVLFDHAVTDQYTGTVPNTTWGYGKIDVLPLAEFIINDAPESMTSNLPDQFAISTLYPNPFNARATAVVSLPRPVRAEVALFNMLGQKVGLVARGVFTAGQHTVSLNANSLASGTYLLHLATEDGQSLSRKVTVLK
ncbi:S8 family peptidase [bacterium]|nr:S8 family peptidase [bacterium]